MRDEETTATGPLNLIPLEEVPDHLPRRRGRKHHRSTIFRWAAEGVSGVKLRTVRMGRTQVTRPEWLDQFFEGIAEARDKDPDPPPARSRARERLARDHGLKPHGHKKSPGAAPVEGSGAGLGRSPSVEGHVG